MPSDTLFGDDFYCICFDHPTRETAMLSTLVGFVGLWWGWMEEEEKRKTSIVEAGGGEGALSSF